MISNKIKPYLDDIAEKLWTGHASVMVGAGFSKNASSKFPDWNQLGDIFYEKIKGVKPEPSNVQYANVLKMADSVDAAFGRPELNKILKEAIPDISVSPSKVHIDLVTLPWAEVFTTNYDTLLERAAEQVTTRRYDIVKRQDDLVFSKSPRILKLHGCFSSSSDLIISEEDYRTYPARYAPFVNTVQQALLETALCLIGFSGDDPNFLKWVGWIRDNLGRENSAPIYLIGYFSMSEAEKRLLEKRNIVVVDMSLCEDIDDHAKAIQAFITHLKSKQEAKSATKWPHKIQMSQYIHTNDSKEQLSSFVKSVSNLKSTYPGWMIAPHSVREKLSHLSNGWYQFNKLETEDSNAKLDYFYYCCWLSKLCLTPIFDDFANRLEDYLNSINGNISNLCLKKLSFITLTLVRYYREEFLWDSWGNWLAFCDGLSESLSVDDTQHIQLERLYALLYKNNISTLCQNLATWRVEQKSYSLRLKKAALLAELGEIKDALEEAKAVLQNVRKQLNLAPESGDYFLRSVESYAMLLVRMVDGADDFSSRKRYEEFSERWELLKSTLCDPWGELEFFDARLDAGYFPRQIESKKPTFDIGSYQTNYNMGADIYAMNAMALFRFYEEAGLPIKVKHTVINAKVIKNAACGTVNYFPQWTLHYLLRLGDAKHIKDVWNRKAIIAAPMGAIENISSLLLNLFEEIEAKLSVSNSRIQSNLYDRYATVIPELLSMLISRLSFKHIYRAYNIAMTLYRSEKYKKFEGLELLIKRALKTTSKKQQGDLAKLALMCSCPESIHPYEENKLEPPIWQFDDKIISDLVVDDQLIEKSIELM